jgi:hypothetical protein
MCGRGGGSRKLCGEQCLRRAGFFFARGGPWELPEPASRERGPSCPPAGHPTEKTRSNGQPNRLDRKSRFPVLKTGDASERIDCSTFYCSTLSASRRADLRVCSAGHPTKNTRPNGQPNRLDRQSRFPVLETGDASERIDCSTFDCSTLSASGRADLRVRSAGYPTDNPRPNGQPNRLDRQSQCGPICRHGGIDPSSTPAGAIP